MLRKNVYVFSLIIFSLLIANEKFKSKRFYPNCYFKFLPGKCFIFNYILNLTTNSCENQCIKNCPMGRFGNNLIEILRGVQFAKATGIKEIYVPHGFLQQKKSFNYKDIKFGMAKNRRFKYFHNECQNVQLYYPFSRLPRTPFEIDPEFRDWLLSQFPQIDVPDDSLVIHVRSGDIFDPSKYLHPGYGQPPCNYYLDSFKMSNLSKMIIVAEDDKNPCVNFLKQHSGMHKLNDVYTDFGTMLNAKNLVASRGSLSLAILLLSKKIKNFFAFNMSSSRIIDHWNCVPTDDYSNTILTKWNNNQTQREIMLSSKCAKWEFIPHGNQNLDAFLHEQSI